MDPGNHDGRQREFTFRLSRRRKLHNKLPIFLFSDYPILHKRNLATNKARAEGPTTVRGHLYTMTTEKVTGVSTDAEC